MKKYFNLILLILLFNSLGTSNLFGQNNCPPWDTNCSGESGSEGQGGGTKKTPIDNYLPILIITAVTIAGIYSYKQRKLIQK